MSHEDQATIEVRNALFEVAEGKPFGAIMMDTIMAQARIAADTCKGDEAKTRGVLAEYHRIMQDAVPIYCTQVLTGQDWPS